MVVHLGRLRLVVRRKEGKCKYKFCPKDHIVKKGEKVFLVTKLGNIPGRTVIFYKAFHRDCFSPWALYMHDTLDPEGDGRPKMELSEEGKKTRAKLVRTRSRLLRRLRTVTEGETLNRIVEHIATVDQQIKDTGYPVSVYAGRRSSALVAFEKFVKSVRGRYKSERRVPRSLYARAKEMGMEPEFRAEMDKWREEEIEHTQSGGDFETQEEDREEDE